MQPRHVWFLYTSPQCRHAHTHTHTHTTSRGAKQLPRRGLEPPPHQETRQRAAFTPTRHMVDMSDDGADNSFHGPATTKNVRGLVSSDHHLQSSDRSTRVSAAPTSRTTTPPHACLAGCTSQNKLLQPQLQELVPNTSSRTCTTTRQQATNLRTFEPQSCRSSFVL